MFNFHNRKTKFIVSLNNTTNMIFDNFFPSKTKRIFLKTPNVVYSIIKQGKLFCYTMVLDLRSTRKFLRSCPQPR